jgi:hypothetical protein
LEHAQGELWDDRALAVCMVMVSESYFIRLDVDVVMILLSGNHYESDSRQLWHTMYACSRFVNDNRLERV